MTKWMLASHYRFAGVHCGLRPDPQRLDLALIVSDVPATAAGVFTRTPSRAKSGGMSPSRDIANATRDCPKAFTSSTDPKCAVGTVGRATLYASYNGVRSDSVQFFLPAACKDQDHLYHGTQVNTQVPPL